MYLDNIKSILENELIFLSDKIYYSLSNVLNVKSLNKTKSSNHICLLIDNKNNEVLSYAFNIFFKTNSFPFSIHSEINVINKYYKKNLSKSMLKSKKKLIIIKISKIGIIGQSKPCVSCANFIYNNMDNLNIVDVLYSTSENKLENLKKDELLLNNFKLSSGSTKKNRSK
jgi:cytidine deaminase